VTVEGGRRGGRHVRERVLLKVALQQIGEPCPFCHAIGVSSWNRLAATWRVVLFHEGSCPVPGDWSREADCESYTRSVLKIHGIQAVGDYNEPLLIESHVRGFWTLSE
jgi:hypothetical protein